MLSVYSYKQDILLTENTSTYTSNDNSKTKQRLSKSIDIKGAITLSAAVISFLVTLQLMEKAGSNNFIQIIIFSLTSTSPSCDISKNKPGTKHFKLSAHPVIKSFQVFSGLIDVHCLPLY